jgi:hypothetical protein
VVLAGDLEGGGRGGPELVWVGAEFVQDRCEAGAVAVECGDQQAWVQRRRCVVPAAADGLALTGLLLTRVVSSALAPLGRMTTLAGRIAAGNRGERLHPDTPDTDLGRTAVAFDRMPASPPRPRTGRPVSPRTAPTTVTSPPRSSG